MGPLEVEVPVLELALAMEDGEVIAGGAGSPGGLPFPPGLPLPLPMPANGNA